MIVKQTLTYIHAFYHLVKGNKRSESCIILEILGLKLENRKTSYLEVEENVPMQGYRNREGAGILRSGWVGRANNEYSMHNRGYEGHPHLDKKRFS